PFVRSLRLRKMADLGLEKNPRWRRDAIVGFILSAIPLLCYGVVLLILRVYVIRNIFSTAAIVQTVVASVAVPFIEEAFFRGLMLGLLLRSGKRWLAMFVTSAFYSVVHFLKSSDQPATTVTWTSGFNAIAHAFGQFREPM